jgi:cell wall assembly regulator SMI1
MGRRHVSLMVKLISVNRRANPCAMPRTAAQRRGGVGAYAGDHGPSHWRRLTGAGATGEGAEAVSGPRHTLSYSSLQRTLHTFIRINMKSLTEFENWLTKHLPEVAADLNPGASANELQVFSAALDVKLPNDFLHLYAWHNGQGMTVNAGPWYGLNFLPLDAVQRECEMWRNVLKESSPESLTSLAESMKSTPPGFVKRQYANAQWIPFAYDHGGNFLGVDLSPDEHGTYGQVINFGRDEDRKIAVSPSISTFIDWMLKELNADNFNIKKEDDGGRSFNTLRPEKYHFFDALALMFPEH